MRNLICVIMIALITASLFCFGCATGEEQTSNSNQSATENSSNINGSDSEASSESSGQTTYPDQSKEKAVPLILPEIIEPAQNLEKFILQAQDNFSAQREGIIVSPYYAVKVGKITVPVYAVPTSTGKTQNVAFIDVAEDMFPCSIRVSSTYAVNNVEVIPEKYNITCFKQGNDVLFNVNGYGYYTAQFNGSYDNVLTVCVREKVQDALYDGYNVIEYKKGIHFIDYMDIPSNTVFFLHSGAYLIANAPKEDEVPEMKENYHGETTWRPFISAKNASNIKIVGRGVLDMSALYWCARNPIDINRCENVEIDGVTIVNTANWNITVANSKKVKIKNVVLLSYRRNSDGIAIVDCDGAVISDCFARSGDDLFEVKSMYDNTDVVCKNIRFERCVAWADSCRCFGVIHETKNDIADVTFEDSAVLYAMATWSNDMGSLVVINGIRGTVSNITFRNIEVYSDVQYALNVATGPNEWSEGNEIGKIVNILYENIRIVKSGRVRIKAPDTVETYVTGITFKNIAFNDTVCSDLDDLKIEGFGKVGEVNYERT